MSWDTGTAITFLFWLWVGMIGGLFVGLVAWVGLVAVRMWRNDD